MLKGTRISPVEHAKCGWRVAEIAPDFTLIDAWALPATGRLEDFSELCNIILTLDPAGDEHARISNLLFAIRFRVGEWFGWDKERDSLPIPGCNERSLSERLPDDLKPNKAETAVGGAFRVVFRTDTELAAEVSNSTVHAILHLGWVAQPDGTYNGQLGVYVKPRGRFGSVYMAAISPFRHSIVYPALMRRIGRSWQSRGQGSSELGG